MKKYSFLSVILILFVVNSFPVQAQRQHNKVRWQDEISSNYFYIKCAKSNKYWDLPGKHPNTAKRDLQFQIWDNDNDKYERTFIFPRINGTDYYAIKNLTGYIVDVAGKKELSVKEKIQKKTGKKFKMKKDNSVEIQTWDADPKGIGDWQQWRIIVVDRNTFMLENVFSRKAISVEGGGMGIESNGSKLVQWDRNGNSGQLFQLVYAEGRRAGQLLEFE
ncbi:MAG: RICIN domain-containing protein [Bacteroidetes bacterium]|nr:RICIN domain-containing protein [Bacteroidota bacterium]